MKKITKWEPEDFELEMTTHWSFPKRGDWATHDAKWRGNWSPYIPRNIILRYSQDGDLILDEMEKTFSRVVNYNVSVKEIDNKVVFLRKLARGGSEHSFGIHVAKLAGMPQSIVKRADEVLHQLESANRKDNISKDLGAVAEQCGSHRS